MTFSRLLVRSVDLLPWGLRNIIRTLPGIAPAQRWLVNRVLSGREFVHKISAGPAKGLWFRVTLPDDKLYWTGTWEQDITSVIANHMQSGSICLDIGAHRGFMAGVMALNGAKRAICFEPNPENSELIQDLIRLNDSLNIDLLPFAVGAENTNLQFAIMPESSMGKLANSKFQNEEAGTMAIDVEVRTLDDLITNREIPIPNFIKIDIEGAELDALQGATNLISQYRPTLLIEVHSYELLIACVDNLHSHGYEISSVQTSLANITVESFRVCHILACPK